MFLGKSAKIEGKHCPEGIPLGQNGQIDDCSGQPPMLQEEPSSKLNGDCPRDLIMLAQHPMQASKKSARNFFE
jgi:hypothetical protein